MKFFVAGLALIAMLRLSTAACAVEGLFDAPCVRYGVPKALALAIARQESGLRPWAVNVAGRDCGTGSRADALRAANAAFAAGKSFDVGIMQVNVWWLRQLGISPETAIEPAVNVTLGVWILAREIARHGLNWRAIAHYHTPLRRNPERGRAYAASVIRRIQRIQGVHNAAPKQQKNSRMPEAGMVVQRPGVKIVNGGLPGRTATGMLVKRFYCDVGALKM